MNDIFFLFQCACDIFFGCATVFVTFTDFVRVFDRNSWKCQNYLCERFYYGHDVAPSFRGTKITIYSASLKAVIWANRSEKNIKF